MKETLVTKAALTTSMAAQALHNIFPDRSVDQWIMWLQNNRNNSRSTPYRIPFTRLSGCVVYNTEDLDRFADWERLRALGTITYEVPSLKHAPSEGCADDIRASGWAVAVHNDYRLNDVPHTFWLFTKGNRCVKGEGKTDAEALNQVRAQLKAMERL
jgi:hypothetical protein